jgi:hypothetical protein
MEQGRADEVNLILYGVIPVKTGIQDRHKSLIWIPVGVYTEPFMPFRAGFVNVRE